MPLSRRSVLGLGIGALSTVAACRGAPRPEPRARPAGRRPTRRHRLLVLTDLTSIRVGEAEPDDAQSLIRLLLYLDVVDLVGLVASSGLGHAQAPSPHLAQAVLDAYAEDWPALRRHGDYPRAAELRSLVWSGQGVAGRSVPVERSVGDGRATEASEAIVRLVDAGDPAGRPLWVTAWGGTVDLAQALHDVRRTRPRPAVDAFVAQLRLHNINDQDATGPWLRQEFPGLPTIKRDVGHRGMYRGGDTSLRDDAWVRQHVTGRGALGALYPNYRGGDIWTRQLGPVLGIKEGDTPSFLNLVHGEDPLRGWGGTFVEAAPGQWVDAVAPDAAPDDLSPVLAGVYRHRPAFQADFAARLARLG